MGSSRRCVGVAGRSLTHKDSWVTEQEAPAQPIRHLWEAPVFTERTSVGLDVHARSIVAAAVDGQTSELHQARLTLSFEHVRSWLATLPGPVAVAYEASPTGFGLYRDLTAAGIRCEVVAPSKLQRRSVTGSRPMCATRSTWRDYYGWARPPRCRSRLWSRKRRADLVRAREDCRGDLMRARHRLSKLLLRHGMVYDGGAAWTGAHDRWLRTVAAPALTGVATQMAFDADYEHVLTMKARRDRLDVTIAEMAGDSEFTPIVRRMSCLRGVSTLTAFALSVEIGDWDRFTGNSIGSFVGLVPSERSSGTSRVQGRSPRPAIPTPAGCWLRQPGTIVRGISSVR